MRSPGSLLEKFIFSSKEHGKINLVRVKSGDEGEVIPWHASGKFGSIRFMEVEGKGYSFRYGIFDIREKVALTTILDIPYTGLFINLGADIAYSQEGIRPSAFYRDHCSLLFLPYTHIRTSLEKGRFFVCDVWLSLEYLQSWRRTYRSLSRLMSKIRRGIPVLEKFEVVRGGSARRLIDEGIERMTAADREKDPENDAWMGEALSALFEAHQNAVSAVSLHPADIEKLRRVQEMLIHHPDTVVSLKNLAREMAMNEFKLKDGFKRLFGTPVFKFLFEERMKKARHLLSETDKPIGEIAVLVGYKNVASFSAAYRKRFGYPPSGAR